MLLPIPFSVTISVPCARAMRVAFQTLPWADTSFLVWNLSWNQIACFVVPSPFLALNFSLAVTCQGVSVNHFLSNLMKIKVIITPVLHIDKLISQQSNIFFPLRQNSKEVIDHSPGVLFEVQFFFCYQKIWPCLASTFHYWTLGTKQILLLKDLMSTEF